jgi:hypothetical protein
MENEKKFPREMKDFLEEFISLISKDRNLSQGNDKMMHTALFYEKFRRAVEYQEDHLIFKNAVSRIVKRRYSLSFSLTPESLFEDLMNELAWADYINLETLSDHDIANIKKILSRYLILLKELKPKSIPRYEAEKMVIGWLACEIDEVLFCRKQQEALIDFAFFCLKDNLKYVNHQEIGKEGEIQLKLSILTSVYKPDYAYAQYWLVRKLFPDFSGFDSSQAVDIGSHFDNIIKQTEKIFKSPHSKEFLSYTKKYIAPFILMKELPKYYSNLEEFRSDPEKFKNSLMDVYDKLLTKTKEKVWRGTFRALIFIFLTKISLAFLIEMPFDQFAHGKIVYIPLIINIFLPPLLMLFAGLSVKTPPVKNRQIVYQSIDNLIIYQKIDSKPSYIGLKHRTPTDIIFNTLYLIFNLAILIGVIYYLSKIGFNVVSIALFFTFVSAVSFFAFRIRNIALELMMHILRENFFISIIEFVFLPFILIGKLLSAAITKSNPFTITLDFLIEAPLKSIIKITNSWLRFIKQKKEDLDF